MKTATAKAGELASGVRKRRARTSHSAAEKCRAVLSVWSERRKPTEVCRELGVPWGVLSQWQERAMAAMLAALEPQRRQDSAREPALGEKLSKLLERKSVRGAGKLEDRLTRIQTEATPEPKAST